METEQRSNTWPNLPDSSALASFRLKTPSQKTNSSRDSIMDHLLSKPAVLFLRACAIVKGADMLPTRSRGVGSWCSSKSSMSGSGWTLKFVILFAEVSGHPVKRFSQGTDCMYAKAAIFPHPPFSSVRIASFATPLPLPDREWGKGMPTGCAEDGLVLCFSLPPVTQVPGKKVDSLRHTRRSTRPKARCYEVVIYPTPPVGLTQHVAVSQPEGQARSDSSLAGPNCEWHGRTSQIPSLKVRLPRGPDWGRGETRKPSAEPYFHRRRK